MHFEDLAMPLHRVSAGASGSLGSLSRSRASPLSVHRDDGSQTSRAGRPGRLFSAPRASQDSQHGLPSGNRAQNIPTLQDSLVHSSGTEQEDHPREVQNSMEPIAEIIMAIDLKDAKTLGCAYFDTERGALLLCTDILKADLDVVDQLLAHIQPTTVLVPGRAPEHLFTLLEEKSVKDKDEVISAVWFTLRAMSSSEFWAEAAHDKLVALQTASPGVLEMGALNYAGGPFVESNDVNVNGVVDLDSRAMRLIKCSTRIDLESQVSVGCAGAVLSEINRRRSAEYLPGGHQAGSLFQVMALDMFSLRDSVYVTQETLSALQIVQSEQHPNSQISGGGQSTSGSKESLSIYGLFHHIAGTPQGRVALRRLFLRPTQDRQVIAERQDFISLFMKPEHAERMKQLSKALHAIGNVRRVVSQLQKGAESPSSGQSDHRGAWSMLRRFVTQVLKLRDVIISIQGYKDVAPMLQFIECIDVPSLILVGSKIEQTIDFEDSKERQRLCVRAGVDPQLDQMKRLYDGMSSLLTQVVDHIRAHIPEWARQYVRSCIFLPQLGFLTVIDSDPETGNGKFEGEGIGSELWERLFASDGLVCYKNKFMKELDDQYGDMYCEIGDREVEIIHNLASQTLRHEQMLVAVSESCGQIDALLALAIGAEKYNWSRPQMTEDDRIYIEDGRHPLQELVVPCFIPNDCNISGPRVSDHASRDATMPRALVLTGPNHSGKSIYLKQAATIIYLAQVGSFVPAKRAVLGFTDRILTRISTRESVSRVESAFAIDLKQIAQVMRGVTARSLVLIDEFGKGTNSDDGAGLLTALIDHLLEMGHECPRILLATHFHEIFEGGYLSLHCHLEVAHMEIEIDKDSKLADNHLTYLFRLAPGHSSTSFGGTCAALNGVPGAVVRRAEAMSLLIARHEDLVTACSQLSKQEEENLERAESVARRFLEADVELLSAEEPGSESTGQPEMPMMALLSHVLGETDRLQPQ